MKTKEFSPSKKLKAIWLVLAFAGSNAIAGLCSAIAVGADLNGAYTYWVSLIISLLLIAGYLSVYFPTIQYSIDNEYVVSSSGVFWKVRRSVPLDKITNIDIRQGPLERLLGFGQIWIFTPSTGSNIPEEKLIGVQDPYRVKSLIMDLSQNRNRNPDPETASSGQGIITSDSSIAVLNEILITLKAIERKMDQK